MKHDSFDYQLDDILTREDYSAYSYLNYQKKPKQADDKPATVKRLHLFWGFRYSSNSYKARKAGISRPSVMMKYKNDKFRLYGSPEDNKLFDHCKGILKGWKARSKAEMKALKKHRVKNNE